MTRKKPFSGKQKKQQLKEKKSRKNKTFEGEIEDDDAPLSDPVCIVESHKPAKHDRFKLQLEGNSSKSTDECSSKDSPISIPEKECFMEVSYQEIHYSKTVIALPQKPEWNVNTSKRELEKREKRTLEEFINKLEQSCEPSDLGYLEHNLETWRQLWRVVEISDIILLITDVRHPIFHLPPSLLNFILDYHQKPAILILNKIDLVPAGSVCAWKEYFTTLFPSLSVSFFTSYPKEQEMLELLQKKVLKRPKRRQGKDSPVGISDLLAACEKHFPEKDFSKWKAKLADKNVQAPSSIVTYSDNSAIEVDHSMLTLGLIGHPNVGKSTFLNGLIGDKVVSTSKTPGHTKYLQTIFLTDDIRICDCPGVVFPSVAKKELQILCGVYPIAQLKSPYAAISLLAHHLPIHLILKLKHPRLEDGEINECIDTSQWSPKEICEAWAIKRGYLTAKAGRPDTYRAANSILRLVVDGRIPFNIYPQHYSDRKDEFNNSDLALKIKSMQKQCTGLKDSNEAWSDIEIDINIDAVSSEDQSDVESDCEGATSSTVAIVNRFDLLLDE